MHSLAIFLIGTFVVATTFAAVIPDKHKINKRHDHMEHHDMPHGHDHHMEKRHDHHDMPHGHDHHMEKRHDHMEHHEMPHHDMPHHDMPHGHDHHMEKRHDHMEHHEMPHGHDHHMEKRQAPQVIDLRQPGAPIRQIVNLPPSPGNPGGTIIAAQKASGK